MSSQPSSEPPQGYSSFYQHVGLTPEVGLFRRFGAYWAKRIHDETSEVLACTLAVDDEIKKCRELEATGMLDLPRRLVQKGAKYNRIRSAWAKHDRALMRYGETLCMSERIMNLPKQDQFNTKKLKEWKEPDFRSLFCADEFIPTGEKATTYQGDARWTDTCAWRSISNGDILTRSILSLSPWIDKHVSRRWRSHIWKEKTSNSIEHAALRYGRLVAIMDTLTCLIASVLLALTIVVLVIIRPLAIRVALVGVFGTLFALFLKLMASSLTRGEVFGATAAFYAVAAVFVGSSNVDCVCT